MSIQTKKRFLAAGLSVLASVSVALLLTFAGSGSAQSGNTPNGNAYGYYVRNNTPGFVKKAVDQGPADPNTLITVTA